jgi:hypothetical protein
VTPFWTDEASNKQASIMVKSLESTVLKSSVPVGSKLSAVHRAEFCRILPCAVYTVINVNHKHYELEHLLLS